MNRKPKKGKKSLQTKNRATTNEKLKIYIAKTLKTMVEKRHGKWKYKKGKTCQQKIKNNINEMT